MPRLPRSRASVHSIASIALARNTIERGAPRLSGLAVILPAVRRAPERSESRAGEAYQGARRGRWWDQISTSSGELARIYGFTDIDARARSTSITDRMSGTISGTAIGVNVHRPMERIGNWGCSCRTWYL
jgi:hypothetical protein